MLARLLPKAKRISDNMRTCLLTLPIASALITSILIDSQQSYGQNTSPQAMDNVAGTITGAVRAKTADQKNSHMFVTAIPAGYRDWMLISVAHEEGNLNDIRAILGNDIVRLCKDKSFHFGRSCRHYDTAMTTQESIF